MDKKFYVHEFAAVNLSKIYFLQNAKETCEPNNRDLNHDWITKSLNCYCKEQCMTFCDLRNVISNFA